MAHSQSPLNLPIRDIFLVKVLHVFFLLTYSVIAASINNTTLPFLLSESEIMLNDTTFIASAIDVSDIANAKDFPTEPQPSTSNAVSDYVHNETSFNNYKEKIDDVDLFTLSDLGDSVADIPSELYDSSSSDDNVTLSTNWLRKYLKPQPKRQHKTEVLPDDNNPRPINTDEKSIQEENNSIFVADYPGPIFANKQDAQENYIKKSKCSLKRKSRHIMIINSCKSKCSRKCASFSLGNRIQIWHNYWELDFRSRRNFLNKCIQITGIKKRRVSETGTPEIIKKESRFFYFPNNNNESIPVCRKFFLDTLGYKTDGVITEISNAIKKGNIYGGVLKDGRGGNRNEIPKTIIEQHILNYKPVVSHYRRQNAPNVRYLPRNLTLKQMHADFKLKNPDFRCSVEVHRQTIKRLNISFNMPKGDKCAECSFYEEEIKKHTDKSTEVPEDILTKQKEHQEKVKLAIERYRLDGAKRNENRTKYFCMDLQKVVLLPDMPQYKDAFFLSRLVAFKLTFAPIKKKSDDMSVCVLWHEAIAGRDASNIVDALKAFLYDQRDVQHYHLWADNCTAQNKNWTLFTAMVMIVNNEANEIESITINYLTKGHTHMAADAVHANIEQKMRRQRGIYDFGDFKDCELRSRKNIKILEIQNRRNWPKKKRAGRFGETLREFKLKFVVQVKFVKGSRNLFYKTRFDENFQEIEFLQKKLNVNYFAPPVEEPWGVNQAKKDDIISKLVPLMPASRKAFWYNLPVNNQSLDLSFFGQMETID
ncbi:unnamed protein product [Diatraea saccharalis]|uniref:DUF7869 domain-containing protein n=1 Tax=Diatraea saccharalis TaxID=40085 RepID=A0A9P0G2Z9_9NEOP|nr:unnamed protein product [Diatraea saccharalis]